MLLMLGLWLVYSPYSGFTRGYKDALVMLAGAGVIWLAFVIARPMCEHDAKNITSSPDAPQA